jgi:hypothetical protein
MDNGGYKIYYDKKPYTILDETEYFPVFKDYTQIAAFKDKEDALDYVLWIEHRTSP